MPLPNIVEPTTQFNAAFWLEAAQGAVRSYCDWHVAPVIEETLILDGSGSRSLLLPSQRVVELLEVLNEGVDVTTDVDHSRVGILELQSGCWTRRLGKISVRLKHGYTLEEVPEVAGVIAALRSRAMTGASGAVSETIGPASVRRGTGRDGAVLSIPLLQSEKETLDTYRLEWGA